ncbi:phosphoglycerate mutase [Micractinium conductrix]|uniref:Phosphoglycerate mutase n=1 Tax=Micractinium conductrix TaxID=554055 RepID=A0A2P6VJW2_9CHLO|nr:phosphoglycerate mutase [Micractinium conductrix]|eukprot:PSC74382.1 phosphoglycerate mutase [Micractinium conductrix]
MAENPHSPHGNYNPLELVIKAASNSTSYSWCTCSEEICEQQLGGRRLIESRAMQSSLVHSAAPSAPLRRTAARLAARQRHRAALCCQASAANAPIRRLVLMRHAESEAAGRVRDHDREITEAGAETALQVAQQLQEAGWVPQVIVCSTAQRTRQTLDVMQQAMPELAQADAHFLGSLYTTAALDGQTRGHLAEIVASEAAAGHGCCLCLGHNKGWEEAASSFAGQEVRLGNSHAALLEGRGSSWGEALEDGAPWRLVRLLRP